MEKEHLETRLRALYALDGREESLSAARARVAQLEETFGKRFPGREAAFFSGPGRTELGGNHTDHQRGHVLCASVDMDILACAAPNDQGVVRLASEGYPEIKVDLRDLSVHPEEANTSAALVRGVCAAIRNLGYDLRGFDGCAVSTVLPGSGLSSSAAWEVLLGQIMNHFCCGGALDAVTIAQVGQYAENVYFGKPSGLMDQMGAAVGGAVAIDFGSEDAPVVRRVEYDFAKSGHVLCLVDTASDHADLTADYAAITQEMGAVAERFGKSVLREVSEEDFRASLPELRKSCGDRAVLRAMHYYADDRRAVQEAEALAKGDFPAFLRLVNESGLSSAVNLQNTWSIAHPRQQAVPVCLAVGRELLAGRGAIRVHGGGFGGTVQAFVPEELLEDFRTGMEAVVGRGRCHVLHIRSVGACRLR